MPPTHAYNLRIRCARCDKPVDRIDQIRNERGDNLEITAYCHGQKETMTLTMQWLARLSPENRARLANTEGVAFMRQRPKRIEASHGADPGQEPRAQFRDPDVGIEKEEEQP